MNNRYFIANVPNPNMNKIFDVCIGLGVAQRFSLDGSKVVVKLPLGDDNDYGVLSNATEYTLNDIKEVLKGSDWTNNDDL